MLHAGEITLVDWRANKALAHIAFKGSAGLGGIRYDASADRALVDVSNAGQAELWSVRRDGTHTAGISEAVPIRALSPPPPASR